MPLPPAEAKDPVALNRATNLGKKTEERYPEDQVQGLVGVVKAVNFPDLPAKAPGVQVWHVQAMHKEPSGRISMPIWGPNRFHVVEKEGKSYLLTRSNFARVFGPLTEPKEVWSYLAAFERLFGHPYCQIVREGQIPRLREGESVPALSELKKTPEGYDVRLVLYTEYSVRHFWAKNVFVRRDGTVTEGKTKVLKKLGLGYVH